MRNRKPRNQNPEVTPAKQSEDLALLRKTAAKRLNAVGNDVRQLQKDFPYKWNPERCARVNVDLKRLQFCFDERDYRNVLEFSDVMVDEYQLTIERLKKDQPKKKPRREETLSEK